MKATCNYPRARFGVLLSPPWSFNLGLSLRIPQQSGCAESYLLPNRKIHEREKKKQRAFFDELFGELLWTSATKFLLKLFCARVFQSIHFFFKDGLFTLARHENPEIVVLKLHFLSLRSLFVFSVRICLRFMVFFGSREGKRRECGRRAAM